MAQRSLRILSNAFLISLSASNINFMNKLKSCSSFFGKNLVKNHCSVCVGLKLLYMTKVDAANDEDCAITIASLTDKLDMLFIIYH